MATDWFVAREYICNYWCRFNSSTKCLFMTHSVADKFRPSVAGNRNFANLIEQEQNIEHLLAEIDCLQVSLPGTLSFAHSLIHGSKTVGGHFRSVRCNSPHQQSNSARIPSQRWTPSASVWGLYCMLLLLPIDDLSLKVCEEIPEATDSLEALGRIAFLGSGTTDSKSEPHFLDASSLINSVLRSLYLLLSSVFYPQASLLLFDLRRVFAL
jgi:hypothetical protein